MRVKLAGNKRDSVIHIVRNMDTVSIPGGTPVVLTMNGTNDGLGVVLPSTAGATKSQLLPYGVLAGDSLNVGEAGESIVFGYSQFTVVTVLTRSATSASWPAAASVAALQALTIDTANNAFATAATVGTNPPAAVLVDTIAAQAGSATNATDTRLGITSKARAFIRML